MAVDERALEAVAMSRAEYERLVSLLDREPTEVELGMTSALWSEHCGYKHSKPLFRHFPTTGPRVLTEAGAEADHALRAIKGARCSRKIASSHKLANRKSGFRN